MRLAIVLFALVAASSSAQPELVIVREGGTQYHRSGCPLIREGKGVLALSRGEAEARRLKPHPECDPSDPRNTIDTARPTAPVYVYRPIVRSITTARSAPSSAPTRNA